jgi:hypothetical protein
MDRHGSLENALRWRPCGVTVFWFCAWLLLGAAPAAFARKPPAAPTTAETEPIERRPYRISLHLSFDSSARIDDAKRTELVREWQVLVRRFIGAPWIVSIADSSHALATFELDALEPAAFATMTSFDKVWVVRVAAADAGSGLIFSGREFDLATKRVGPLQQKRVPALSDAPRAMLQFARDLFNPTAIITGQEGGRALLTVQGAVIAPASPVGAVVEKGTVFQPLRLVSLADGKVHVSNIKHSYLQVESIEGPVARCAIISSLKDPLSKRVSRPNTLAGLGLKPGNTPLKLRFVTGPEHDPAAGYTLTARLVPDGQAHEQGTTDRAGRIVLKPGFARGLVILRLLAGNVEPIVELPIMPGETADELVLSVDPKPLTVALEARLDSLRDEVVDLVALRARSEARMKARLEGEDWSGLEEELKEFAKLAPRDQFVQKLTQLKDDAAHQQAELKTAILTKTANAQLTDLLSMVERYIDDDAFRAYSEAFDKSKTEQAAAAKAQAKKKAAAPLVPPPGAAKGNVTTAPRAATGSAVPAPPQGSPMPGASAPSRGRVQNKPAPPTTSGQPF